MSVLQMPDFEQGGPARPVAENEDVFSGYVDYFGFDGTEKFVLPDGRQWIEFKPMTEGARARYEASTSRDIKFNRRTDDAAIKMDAAADRRALIEASVTGWNLARVVNGRWEPVVFSKGSAGSTLALWLDKTDPKVVNDLVTKIRQANPWMTEDMTVEMIDEEIARLQELRQQILDRDAKS